jgi:diguanylate cyclase (GGDEF)-like protein
MDNINYLDYFKYNVTKISLFLAIIISLIFFILRIADFIPANIITTVNTTGLLLFLISMYICLLKCKQKLKLIQLITYFILVTFISIQTILATKNIFLPVWLDFTIMTAYIVTDKKTAIYISVYSLFALIAIRLTGNYNIDLFSYITLIMSILAFSLLGFLVAVQLENYNKENIEQSKKLEHLALVDELTDTFNRRAFFKIAQKLLKQASRENKSISIIMIDIDHFKNVNDTYGHKTGDIVLKKFAYTIKQTVRKNDVFARIGGEEFVLFLYDINPEKSENTINKILNKIRNMHITLENKKDLNITASFGVYTFKPKECSEIQQALINADKALYVAKKTGRNRVVYY